MRACWALGCVIFSCVACGGAGSVADAGRDAGPAQGDAAVDAPVDSGVDAGTDAGPACETPFDTVCPSGESCGIPARAPSCALDCLPDGPGAAYERCEAFTGTTTCVAGLVCVDFGSGTALCVPWCRDATECDGSACVPIGVGTDSCAGSVCRPTPRNDCDVFEQTGCDAGEGCYVTGIGTRCAPAGDVPVGGECAAYHATGRACAPGASCYLEAGIVVGRCVLPCDATRTCPEGETCFAAAEGVGICAPTPEG